MNPLHRFFEDVEHLFGFFLRSYSGQKKPPPCPPACLPALKKPDPFLYSQRYLMSLGIPVTWDNPDIFIFEGSTPVDPHNLKANTNYTVVARIWNNSVDVPVVNMGVAFSYLSFGMGAQSHPIGSTKTDLNAKGLPGCPAFASVNWKTPSALGHYCIQVLLEPPDDSDWLNNLGQSNTDVAQPASPARFSFVVGNHGMQRQRRVRFTLDTYAIPPLPACDGKNTTAVRRRELVGPAPPVPDGWEVELTPKEIVLEPEAETTVAAKITPPAGFSGVMPFNVTARDDFGPFGGVTLKVEAK